MRLFLLISLLGCVRQQPIKLAVPGITMSDVCDRDTAGNYYVVGPDGLTGVGESCAAAMEDWRHTFPAEMNRI